MKLLDRVERRAERGVSRSNDPVTLEEFGALIAHGQGGGQTKSGVLVGPHRALAIPAWYSGVRWISETTAFLPVHNFHEPLGGERQERALPKWVKKPGDDVPWPAVVEFWLMSLLHRGNAYGFKVRNEVGQVVGMRPLLPHRVRPGRTSAGQKVFQIDGTDVAYTPREVLHIPGLSYDGIVGLDPITVFAETLGRIAAADEFAAREFGDGFHMSAYLQVAQPLTKTQADALAAQAKALHSGLQNSHQLGVVGNGAEVKTLTLNPEQLQLLESRKWGSIEVAQMLRIVPHKLYNLERATYSNIEHQSIEAVGDGIRPWAQRIETFVNSDPDLVRRNFIEFNLDALLRGDLKARYESYTAGVNAGVLMPSEPRRWERLPHVAGSDYLLRPLNMATVGPDAVDDVDTPDDAPPTDTDTDDPGDEP